MDVTQLPVTQVTNPDTISPSGTESDENGQFVDNDEFNNVMKDVLAGEELNQAEHPASTQTTIDTEPEALPAALPINLPVAVTPELPTLAQIPMIAGEAPLAEAPVPLTVTESPHLAWFAATGFEPPKSMPLDETIPLNAGSGETDAAMISEGQVFLIPPSRNAGNVPPVKGNTEALASDTPAKGDDVDALSLLKDLSGNKKEAVAGMGGDDPLLSMAESTIRLDKRLSTDAAVNHFNGVMSAVNQTRTPAPPPPLPMPAKSLELPVLVDSPEWGNQFSQQITWLGQQKIDRAVIRLNPQELGPLEVNIKFHKDEASLTIMTHTLHVRDMIEQAIPRLRDMMSEQGINLSQFNIESNANQHQAGQQQSQAQQPGMSTLHAIEEGSQDANLSKNSQGLIDYFA